MKDKEITVEKKSPIIESYLITSVIDNSIIINIDGFSVTYNGIIPNPNLFKPVSGTWVNIKHFGKDERTKQFKNPEIVF